MEMGESPPLQAGLRSLFERVAAAVRGGNEAVRFGGDSGAGDFLGERICQRRQSDEQEEWCFMNDEMQLRYVQVARDEESGPLFFQVQVRHAEGDTELSKPRQTTDLNSVLAMFNSFSDLSITARAMFGGMDSVTVSKAMDLLREEAGTRALAKFKATRAELLASLGLLRVRT